MQETSIDELLGSSSPLPDGDIAHLTNLTDDLLHGTGGSSDGSNREECEGGDSSLFPTSIRRSIEELMDDATAHSTGGDDLQLSVCFEDAATRALYAGAEEAAAAAVAAAAPDAEADAGWDLRFTEDAVVRPGTTHTFEFGLSARCVADCVMPVPMLMLPRSSIVKTPLRMANSIGLIDAGYRGPLRAVVDHRGDKPYAVKRGERLFQLIALPTHAMQWSAVECLPPSARGAGGFGSTGV